MNLYTIFIENKNEHWFPDGPVYLSSRRWLILDRYGNILVALYGLFLQNNCSFNVFFIFNLYDLF